MDDSSLPFFTDFEYSEARDLLSRDVDSGLCEDTLQGETNDQASCHEQSINSGDLSLVETESDLLCSRSHTIIHPAYTNLRENCIRLLKILPTQADRTIRCCLEEFSLDDDPTYTAISYTWGSQHGSHAVLVNGHSLLVPKNLWRFLGSARAVGGALSSWLWIDMLSINQADIISERGHQVSLMPAIFRTANLVNVWLGPAYLGSDAALIALARNSNHWRSLSQRRKVWASHVGSSVSELCRRPYWKRLWVYQELKLARRIQLVCGTRTIAWDQFGQFLSLAETDLSARISRLSSFVNDSVDSPAMRMVKLNSKSVHTHLWSLIQATQHLRCFDTRDKAYALLGACTEGHENIKPDYAIPIPTLINKILHEIYKLYPPESLEEALARCDDVEDALAVPRGTTFIIRGQRGSYEVPGEADFRACRLGISKTSLNLWWNAFYGHVAVQQLLLSGWQAEYFASDPSVDESRLTWRATSVARNLFRTCAMETLRLDTHLSQDYASFDSRYEVVEGILLKDKTCWMMDQWLPQERYFEGLVRSMKDGKAQAFKVLLAPGGFLASEEDRVVDLLRAYTVHHDDTLLLLGVHEAGFVDDVTESRFFRSAVPPETLKEQHDPFLGINAEIISRYHHELFDTWTHCEFSRNHIPGKSLKNVVRLPLLSYLASGPGASCISYFLRHPNCDMDVRDENGWTPLIWAARYSNSYFVSRVLNRDEPLCDVNYIDPNGWTPFEHAVLIHRARSFDYNAVDSNGRTRLLRAIENCDVRMAAFLVEEEDCDPNIPDNNGRTPLTLAVSSWQAAHHSEDAMPVSRTQPNTTKPGSSDFTQQAALQMVESEQERLVTLLLRNGADVNLQDSSGRSALMIASALGSFDIVEILLGVGGCDLNLVSHNGDTALSLALGSGHMEVVRLLEEDPFLPG